METYLSARAAPGQWWRVKQTPITRQYGVQTWKGARGDDKAWPGEVGVVVERTWTAHDGSTSRGLWIEFSRGREASVDVLHLDDFVRVKIK